MGIDGRAVMKLVRQSFEEVYGTFSVLGFQVEEVNFEEAARMWMVKCSFTGLGYPARTYYEVLVSEEGDIFNIKKLEAQETG